MNIDDLKKLVETLGELPLCNRLLVMEQPNKVLTEPILYLPSEIYAEWTKNFKTEEKKEYPFKAMEMSGRTFHASNMEAFHPDKIEPPKQ